MQMRERPRAAALEHVLCGVLPAIVTVWFIRLVYTSHSEAVDFRASFWPAAWRLLHGHDPYSWTHAQILSGASFPYPALTALLMAPAALVSSAVSSIPVTLICISAAPAALWLVGVRDWRLLGLILAWEPVVIGWTTANFTLILAVGLAATWRWRERPAVAGALVAAMIATKPIMAPIWLWFVVTRRYRAATWAAALALVATAIGWTVMGWAELPRWLHLLSLQRQLRGDNGYGMASVSVHSLGLGATAGTAITVALSCALAAKCVLLGRQGRQAAAFALAVVLTIVISPQVDDHYFALLAVPLAVVRPRLGWSWILPAALWMCRPVAIAGWQIDAWWVAASLITWETIRGDEPDQRGRSASSIAAGVVT